MGTVDERVIALLEDILQELRKVPKYPGFFDPEKEYPAPHVCNVPMHLVIPPGGFWQCGYCGRKIYGSGAIY